MNSNKILGILLLLIYVCVSAAILNENFIMPLNLKNLLRSSSMFAIIGIGAAMVIVTGGIDLSTGSLIGLVGCTLTMTLKSFSQHPPAENGAWLLWMIGFEIALIAVLWELKDWLRTRRFLAIVPGKKITALIIGVLLILLSSVLRQATVGPWLTMAVSIAVALWLSAHLGLLHGLLITKLKLQPFVVTLCGLMCYRGWSRYMTGDQTQGLGTEYTDSLSLLATGKPCTATVVMLGAGVLLVCFALFRLVFGVGGNRKTNRQLDGSLTQGNSRVFSVFVPLLIGLILAVVASSRYWDGWDVIWGKSFAKLGETNLRFFTLKLSEESVARPAMLMGWGWLPMLVSYVGLTSWVVHRCFFGSSPERNIVRTLAPLVVVIGSAVGLYAIKGWIGDETVTLANMKAKFEPSTPIANSNDVYFAGMNMVLWKMLAVFSVMASLLSGVLWMGKSWARKDDSIARTLWLLTGFFAILWLLGQTAIHETVVQPPFFFAVVIAGLAILFLNKTVQGRYFFALGNNEEAARYSGINTDNITILAYVLCALCGGIASVLFTLDINSVEPSRHGSFYELYAITAAVLGGCSLRGGEGSIIGVIIGATIVRVLYNAPDLIGIPNQLEMFTIGIVLLVGVIVDETARRVAERRDRGVVRGVK